MPSAYTADLHDGKKDVSFTDFTLKCARQFGALIELRDEPLSAPIPDVIEAGTYHAEQAEKARKELARVEKWTDEQAEKKAAASFGKAHKEYIQRLTDKNEAWVRYDQMRDKARAWQPPTADHKPLQDYMVEQLEQSAEHDCAHPISPPVKKSGAEYKAAAIARLTRDIERHDREQVAAEERAQERTEWIQALRESLNESADTPA